MALKELKLENFLGKTVTHSFHQRNRIRGANGSGKTSIKEAISFLFTGMDSNGSRNPQHLISKDQDDCKVVVVTDKAEISRTLTRKGNGTLRITRGGVAQVVTQAQMEASVGSCDLFLSAFIPGYFLELTPEKQHKIISEVSPKSDRFEIIRNIAELEVTDEEKVRYNFNRRVDLIANAVATDRREMDRQAAMKEGEVKQLESLQPLPEPVRPSECERIPYLEQLQKAWSTYETDLRAYNNLAARYERTKIENDLKESKRKELRERLDTLKPLPAVRVKDRTAELGILVSQKKKETSKPAVGTIVEADHCPTCGQTVGKAHRDHVRERNAQIMADYEKEVLAINAHNDGIDEQIKTLQQKTREEEAERSKVDSENTKIASQVRAIEIELAAQVDQELPSVPDQKPSAPEEVFDRDALEKLRSQKVAYDQELTKYNFVQQQIKDAGVKIAEIRNNSSSISSAIARLQRLEDAIRQIPQEELRQQMKAFEMKTVVITVGEKIEVSKDGINYDYLSTGQKAKADVEICQKLNALMPKPINMIFLDNADLVDHVDWGDQQMFAAYVDKEAEAVQIEAV